jgi:branched-chain amino acid transport system permease protein
VLYLFQVLNGIGIGMIYFLISIGLTLIFGIMNFVNFAHGAFYLLGAYLGYQLALSTGSFTVALIVAPLVLAAIGWLSERYFLNRLYEIPHTYQILVTLGLSLVIQELVISIWGPVGTTVAIPEALRGVIFVAGFPYPKYRIFVVLFAGILALLVWFLLERTRYGAILRAGSESTQMVSMLGIDIYRLFSATFALGALLAGIAGVLSAPLRGTDPFMSGEALAIGFVVVVIGGLGRFEGALAGSILVGVVQSVMSSVWSEGANIMIYVAMGLVILLRPRGLFGRA